MRATLLGLIFFIGCGGSPLGTQRGSTTPPFDGGAPSDDVEPVTQTPDVGTFTVEAGTVTAVDASVPVDVGPVVGQGDPAVSGPYLFSFADAICNTSELCHLSGGQTCMFGVMNMILASGPVTGIAVTAYNECMAIVDVPPVKVTPATCDMFKGSTPIPDVCIKAFLH